MGNHRCKFCGYVYFCGEEECDMPEETISNCELHGGTSEKFLAYVRENHGRIQ